MFGTIGIPELIVLFLFVIPLMCVIVILPFWKIFSRAGFSGWLSLTQLVPLLGTIVLFYLAFAEWPALKEPRQMK